MENIRRQANEEPARLRGRAESLDQGFSPPVQRDTPLHAPVAWHGIYFLEAEMAAQWITIAEGGR